MLSRSDNRRLVQEEYPRPLTIAGIQALVGEVLEADGEVQRMIIEFGQPVRVQRLVEPSPMAEPDIDLNAVLRNSQMVELVLEGVPPAQVLLETIRCVRAERLYPVCWATGLEQEHLLERWMPNATSFPGKIDSIFNIDIERIRELPEDTLILCGASYKDAAIKDIVLAVKVAIEIREERDGNAGSASADRARTDPQGHPRPAPALEAPAAAGDRPGFWRPGMSGRGVGYWRKVR